MKTFFAPVILVLALVSCSVGEKVRDYSAEGAARLAVTECQFSIETRRANRDAVTAKIRAQGHPYRAVAQDCVEPFDGQPDF